MTVSQALSFAPSLVDQVKVRAGTGFAAGGNWGNSDSVARDVQHMSMRPKRIWSRSLSIRPATDAGGKEPIMAGDAISTLNNLIETLKDGKNGFETAASDVEDSGVKQVFTEFAAERARMAGELQAEVR